MRVGGASIVDVGRLPIGEVRAFFAVRHPATLPGVEVLPGFWAHHYAENPGAAWSLFGEWPVGLRIPFFVVVTVVAVLAVGWFYRHLGRGQRHLQFALVLLLGGALGNFLDRLARQYVIDFVDVYWRTHHWPAFNVADSCISIGVCLLVIDMLRAPRPETNVAAPAGE